MNVKSSLKINFLMNIVLTMSSFIFPLVTFPYISRVLSPVGIGKISLATSVVTYFSMFAQLGIPTYGIRVCAQARNNKEELSRTVQEILIINLITCTISYLAFFVALIYVPKMAEEKTLYVISAITILFNTIGMEWLYKGLEQYSYITIRSIVAKIVSVIAMFALVHSENDYVIYGGITVFAASAANIFNLIHARHYVDFRAVGKYNLGRHLKPIGIFFAMSCATTIYVNLDTVMIGWLKTDAEVGYYNVAIKIRTLLLSVVTSLGAVLLPRASYYIKAGMVDEFRRINAKAMNLTLLIAAPVTVYFILFAEEGILFLSGASYIDSILPMQIIMPTVIFAGVSNITGLEVLVPMGKEKYVLISEIFGAVLDFGINAIMIPRYGCIGAAIGTTLAEIVVLLVQIIFIRDMAAFFMSKISGKNILLGTFFAVISTMWMKKLCFGSFTKLLVSATVFFAIYIIVMIILKENIAFECIGILKNKMRRKE